MTTAKDKRAELIQQAIRLKKASTRSRASGLLPRPIDQAALLGDMQRGLWLVHQMDPRSPAYNLTSGFRVHGSVRMPDLQRALNRVVARHRLLRSTFRAQGDTVLQIIQAHSPLQVEVLEVGEGEGLAAAIQESRKPFDLESGPLIRMRLIEESTGLERILLLILPHILADERSLAILWQELAVAYETGPEDGAPDLQFDDYVHWLRRGDQEPLRQGLEYWRRRLDPLPEDLRLPFEGARAAVGSGRGRLLSRTLGDTVQPAIRRLASETGTTPFAVAAFTFRLLLQRYTQGQSVAFATPVSTRSHPATAEMIGYFLNPVVISAPIDEAHAVQHAVAAFGGELRESIAHASVPFDRLAGELAPPRTRDRHPIFQAMFVYQEASPPPRLGGARLEPVTLDLGESKFDLSLFVTEGRHSLEVAVEYRTDRFRELWMNNLLGHYETLLENLSEDLERRTSEVTMLAAEEQGRLHSDAQGAELYSDGATLLPQRILDQTRRSPQSSALLCGGLRMSYGELERSASTIAHELAERGVGPDDRVALFLDRSTLMIAGVLGCHWAGAAYVPLDPEYPEARNRHILEDAEVAAVLTNSTLRSRLPEGPWSQINLDDLDGGSPRPVDLSRLTPESPAYILYTSGSTGRPKGVVVTHGNLSASISARLAVYDSPPKRFLLVPSVAFDSSVAGIFWMLALSGTLVIPTDDEIRDPRRLARLVGEERVTGLLCVPSLYMQLLRTGGEAMQALEVAIVAGESCPSRLVEEHFHHLPHVRLFNEYGPTEATVWATVHEMTGRDAGRPVSIGRPIPGVRIDLLDGLGRRVPAGIPGDAWIIGPTVAHGYWRRPDLTGERFDPGADGTSERKYRTGDRMAWTADGRLLFLGREDEQIKLRGFRIEPGEIEAALLEHPEIGRAAVVARAPGASTAAADPQATQLVAFVEAAGTATVTSWRHNLEQRLPGFMIPSRLVELDELPRLPNGKLDRQQLRDMALDSEPRSARGLAVPSTLEHTLVSLWEGLLGRSAIASTENFFELGGHSLLVVEMVSAIERDLEVSLSVPDVFENPTVRELALRIEQRGGSKTPSYQHLFPIQPAGHKMPFIVAVPHFFTEMLAARFRGERPVYGLRGVSLRPEGNRGRWPTMRALAEELVDEICRRFPRSSCIMAGYSFGASMAVEAVRVMEERGLSVHRLYLIAPMPVDFFRIGPVRLQLDGLQEPVEALSIAEALRLYARGNNPLTRRPYRRVWRWFAIEPWRRLLCLVGKLRSAVGLPLTSRNLHADIRVERFRLHAGYKPQPVHTPTVIFNAEEAETDAAATWRPFFTGPFTVHDTPDPHLGEGLSDASREAILHHLSDMGDS